MPLSESLTVSDSVCVADGLPLPDGFEAAMVEVLFGLTERGQTGSRYGDAFIAFLHIFDQ